MSKELRECRDKYMDEAREILEALYFNMCETKPEHFKTGVGCLATILERKGRHQEAENQRLREALEVILQTVIETDVEPIYKLGIVETFAREALKETK